MNHYEEVKAKYERVRAGNNRLHKRIDKVRADADNNPELKKLEAKAKRLQEQLNKAWEAHGVLEEELLKPCKRDLEKLRDYDHVFSNHNLKQVQEEYDKAREKWEAEQLAKTGVFTLEQAHAFAKGECDDINKLWEDRPYNEKDGKFYHKATLKNGVQIYHNKASDYDSIYCTSYNTYFAFLRGKFVGRWRKRRTYHPGDWSDDSMSWVGKERHGTQGLKYVEWKQQLEVLE